MRLSTHLCASQVRYVGVADLSNILSFAKLHLLGRSTQCFDCLAETALNSLVFIEPPLFYIDTRYALSHIGDTSPQSRRKSTHSLPCLRPLTLQHTTYNKHHTSTTLHTAMSAFQSPRLRWQYDLFISNITGDLITKEWRPMYQLRRLYVEHAHYTLVATPSYVTRQPVASSLSVLRRICRHSHPLVPVLRYSSSSIATATTRSCRSGSGWRYSLAFP